MKKNREDIIIDIQKVLTPLVEEFYQELRVSTGAFVKDTGESIFNSVESLSDLENLDVFNIVSLELLSILMATFSQTVEITSEINLSEGNDTEILKRCVSSMLESEINKTNLNINVSDKPKRVLH